MIGITLLPIAESHPSLDIAFILRLSSVSLGRHEEFGNVRRYSSATKRTPDTRHVV